MTDVLNSDFLEVLPLAPKRTAPGEYDIVSRDGRVLWSMEGWSLAEWICGRLNDLGRRGLHCGKCGDVMVPVTNGPHVVGMRCRVCA